MASGTHRIKTERIVDHLVCQGLAALPDLISARRCLDQLAILGGDRAVFGTCVLTLELALLKDATARDALPKYVGVLLQAFHDPRIANVLVAGSPELEARWNRIRPIVADFVALQNGSHEPVEPRPSPEAEIPEVEAQAEEAGSAPPAPVGHALPRLATPTELIEEIQEILEVEESQPPPPPSEALQGMAKGKPRPPPRMPSEIEIEIPLDPETRAFWNYAEKALGRVPDPNQSVLGSQSFAASRSSDRSHLVRFSHDLLARFPNLPHARALASLTLLYVAGQEKERGLLGVNKERLKLISTGLSLLGDSLPAGQVAVLFESDGPETRRAFGAVVELVAGYLGYCSRERLDSKQADSVTKYMKSRL